MKIALINMPFASLYRPSIGISLLQTGLQNSSHKCDTYYLNLQFASMVGATLYNYFAEDNTIPHATLVGEWIFSQSLYHHDNFHAYQNYIDRVHFKNSSEKRATFLNRLLELRDHVEPFLNRALSEHPWEQYDVIGFTSVFQQNVAALSFAKRLKAKWPDKFIIFGGANCEGEMGRVLLQEFPFVDAVCSGEGDLSFIEFINQLRQKNDPSQCDSQGIILHPKYTNDSSLLLPESSPPVHDMDALPYPNYDGYFEQFEKYGLQEKQRHVRFLFESSRGCWWGAKSHCRFCGLNGSTLSYRSKSADRALEELLFLRERYQMYTNKAAAVDNIMDMQYFRDLLPQIRDMQLDLDMFYETKANLTKEQVQLFHDAGFHFIQPGIESMITSVLRLMRKGVSMLQNVQLLKWSKEFGVKPMWNFLYGFPGENEEEYRRVPETIQALSHLDPPDGCAQIRLDRFSPYFDNAAEYGIVNIRPMPAYQLVYQTQPLEILMRLAYHFEFDYETKQDPDSYTQELRREVQAWQSQHIHSEFFSVNSGDHLIIVDLRPFRLENHLFTLTGLEKTLYLYCDNMRSDKTIFAYLDREGIPYSKANVHDILDRFVKDKMMLTESGVYLSLAIPLGNYTPKRQGLERLMQIQSGSENNHTAV